MHTIINRIKNKTMNNRRDVSGMNDGLLIYKTLRKASTSDITGSRLACPF